jgi:hypothetical protein
MKKSWNKVLIALIFGIGRNKKSKNNWNYYKANRSFYYHRTAKKRNFELKNKTKRS